MTKACYENFMTTPDAASLQDLYLEAFARFRADALWNKRQLANPTPADALVVARALRAEGDLNARRLAEAIEARANAVD